MKLHCLIIEDEAALVELLRYNLEQEGFRVSAAADGEEALVMVSEDAPDIVILDWMLPLMSGLDVCRQLRRRPETRTIPIIMLTARGEEGDRSAASTAAPTTTSPSPSPRASSSPASARCCAARARHSRRSGSASATS